MNTHANGTCRKGDLSLARNYSHTSVSLTLLYSCIVEAPFTIYKGKVAMHTRWEAETVNINCIFCRKKIGRATENLKLFRSRQYSPARIVSLRSESPPGVQIRGSVRRNGEKRREEKKLEVNSNGHNHILSVYNVSVDRYEYLFWAATEDILHLDQRDLQRNFVAPAFTWALASSWSRSRFQDANTRESIFIENAATRKKTYPRKQLSREKENKLQPFVQLKQWDWIHLTRSVVKLMPKS